MFRSIRWRTATAFVVLILICIGGFSAYLSHFFKESYLDNLRAQLTDQAYLIGDTSASYFPRSDISIDALSN